MTLIKGTLGHQMQLLDDYVKQGYQVSFQMGIGLDYVIFIYKDDVELFSTNAGSLSDILAFGIEYLDQINGKKP